MDECKPLDAGKSVLITSHTHNAVDNILAGRCRLTLSNPR